MTDDQELIAELREYADGFGYLGKVDIADLLTNAADALSAAAVRYRAEGAIQGLRDAAEFARDGDGAENMLSRWLRNRAALLDENNETQEN